MSDRVDKKEVAPFDNRPLAHLTYDKVLVEYISQNLTEPEQRVFNMFYDSIKVKYKIRSPNELMLLDMACFDFIRMKRLEGMLGKEGDIITQKIMTRQGEIEIRKVHEAAYLLNAIRSSFRQTFKELLLTTKEQAKVAIGQKPKSFDEWLKDNTIEVGDETTNLPTDTKKDSRKA